jgi:hypothetical protein
MRDQIFPAGNVVAALLRMPMSKSISAAFLLLMTATSMAAPAIARDLPFAPPRQKPTAPVVFSPYTHEALVAKLEPGWKLAGEYGDGKKVLVMKFIPPGVDPDGYSPKMINLASFLDVSKKTSALDYMEANKKTTEQMMPKGSVSWQVLESTNPDDVLFAYSIKGSRDGSDQFEMQRVIKGRDGIHTVIYHVGNPDVADADQQKMHAWLKTVKVRSKEEITGTPALTTTAQAQAPGGKAETVAAGKSESTARSLVKQVASPNIGAPTK